ncbi:MAG TPA: hypothetical protein V6C76_13285 [Drouetiella sp.]
MGQTAETAAREDFKRVKAAPDKADGLTHLSNKAYDFNSTHDLRQEQKYWDTFARAAAGSQLPDLQIHKDKYGHVDSVTAGSDHHSLYSRKDSVDEAAKHAKDQGHIKGGKGPYDIFRDQGMTHAEAAEASGKVVKAFGTNFREGEKVQVDGDKVSRSYEDGKTKREETRDLKTGEGKSVETDKATGRKKETWLDKDGTTTRETQDGHPTIERNVKDGKETWKKTIDGNTTTTEKKNEKGEPLKVIDVKTPDGKEHTTITGEKGKHQTMTFEREGSSKKFTRDIQPNGDYTEKGTDAFGQEYTTQGKADGSEEKKYSFTKSGYTYNVTEHRGAHKPGEDYDVTAEGTNPSYSFKFKGRVEGNGTGDGTLKWDNDSGSDIKFKFKDGTWDAE